MPVVPSTSPAPLASPAEMQALIKGVIMKSPDGTRYRLQVANGGALSAVAA